MKYLYKALKIILKVLLILILVLVFTIFLFSSSIKDYILSEITQYSGFEIKIENIDLDYSNKQLNIFFYDTAIIDNDNTITYIEKVNVSINIFKPTELSVFIDDIVFFTDKINYTNISFNYKKLFSYIKAINIKKTKIQYKNKYTNLINTLIYYNKGKLYFYLSRQDLTINEFFSNKLKKVSLEATLDLEALINSKLLLDISLSNNDLKTYLSLTTDDNYLHITQKLANLNAKIIKNYIPDKILTENLVYWLNNALKSGSILDTTINLDIPISNSASPSLSIISSLENIELNFDNDWPNLLKLNGIFKANLDNISINLLDAYINNLLIEDSKIVIEISNNPTLIAEVSTNSPSQYLGQFITIEPMLELIPNINYLQLSGSATSKILLNVNLVNIDASVMVNSKLTNNTMNLLNSSLNITNIDADMIFTNNTIAIDASANIGKNPIKFNINNDNNIININANSNELAINIITVYNDKLDRKYKLNVISPAFKASVSIATYDNNTKPLVIINNAIINKGDIGLKYIDFTPKQVPNMNIKANNIMIDDYFFPNFSLTTERLNNTVLLKNGKFDDEKLYGTFNGKWDNKTTDLDINIGHDKLSELLQKIGLKESVKGGRVTTLMHTICFCNPWDINLVNIIANASITIEKGVFHNKDASIGRILSLLNIKAIAKRLSLNVSDVVSKGFEYETIKTNLSLNKLYINVNNFNLYSLSSDIDITGGVDINKRNLDLRATVIPSIADSVPVLTYLSSGNAVGLGVWLTDKVLFDGSVLKSLFSKTISFDYIITGDWASPTIN